VFRVRRLSWGSRAERSGPLVAEGAPRQEALWTVLRAALDAVEPAAAVRAALQVDGHTLRVANTSFELRRVVVVGAGKASAPMAAELERLIPADVPVQGSVTVRYGYGVPTQRITIREASHPVPDQAGVEATRAIADLLATADERDLVVCLISGGGSALLTLPVEGVSLDDLQRTTEALLKSGATINEINTVRKHLDTVKGGGLARLAQPAPVLTLVLSDVVGNPLDAIASGPGVPDTTTWQDAASVLDRYQLWDSVPNSVRERLRSGQAGDLPDTPKPGDPLFEQVQTHVVGSNLVACQAAASAAQALGFQTLLLSTYIEGEAREVARVLAGVLREIDASGHPLARPCCVIAGGETTVTVRGNGKGGRNQELALAAAFPLQGVSDVLLASIGTDGSDGPTDAAGAWVDGSTLERARSKGLDPAQHLTNNDAYNFFAPLGDLLITGPTNTNVNDVYVLLAF
jgi:glycerate 2-kinase